MPEFSQVLIVIGEVRCCEKFNQATHHKLNNSFYFIFFQKLMEKMKLKTWTVVGNLNGELVSEWRISQLCPF